MIITVSAAAVFTIAAVAVVVLTRRKRRSMLSTAIFCAAAAAGMLAVPPLGRAEPAWSGLPYETVSKITGCALSDSRRLSSGSYMLEVELLGVEAGKAAGSWSGNAAGAAAEAGGTLLLFFDRNPAVRMGRLISVETLLAADEAAAELMRGGKTGDYSMLKNPVVFTAFPDTGSLTRLGWRSRAAELRAGLMRRIDMRCAEMGPEAGGLFAALFTGSRDGLTAAEQTAFRRSGCSHILALSGMHLGILSGIILLLLRPLPGKKAAFFTSCLIITFYLYLTGFGTSLVRAAVMYFIGGAAAAFYRKYRATDLLLLSFVILVLVDPGSFYTAAFQLSFLAVAGIIIAAPPVNRILQPYLPAAMSMPLSASIGAQLFVSPLLVSLFGELYPAGLAAGIITAFMVTVFIWIGIIYLITGFGVFAAAARLIYRAVFLTAGAAAELPALRTSNTAAIAAVCAAAVILICLSKYRSNGHGLSGQL